jgi:hypothetical protein
MNSSELAKIEICTAFQNVANAFVQDCNQGIKAIKRKYKEEEDKKTQKQYNKEESEKKSRNIKPRIIWVYPTVEAIKNYIQASEELSQVEELEKLPERVNFYTRFLEQIIDTPVPMEGYGKTILGVVIPAAENQIQAIKLCKSLLHIHIAHPMDAIVRARKMITREQ